MPCVGVAFHANDGRARVLVIAGARDAEERRGVELVALDERLEASVQTLQLGGRNLAGQQEVHVVLGAAGVVIDVPA